MPPKIYRIASCPVRLRQGQQRLQELFNLLWVDLALEARANLTISVDQVGQGQPENSAVQIFMREAELRPAF
jgi:hypothetical protein